MGLGAKLLVGLAVLGGGYFVYMKSQETAVQRGLRPDSREGRRQMAESALNKAEDVAQQAKDKVNTGLDKAQDKIQEKKDQMKKDH